MRRLSKPFESQGPRRAAFQRDPSREPGRAYSPLPPEPWPGPHHQPIQEDAYQEQMDPWQAAFTPASQDWYEQDQDYQNPAMPIEEDAFPAPPPARARRKASPLFVFISLISLAVILACGLALNSAYSKEAAFREKLAAMKGNAFFPNITIDGRQAGGQTPQQLRAQWQQENDPLASQVRLALTVDQTVFQLDSSHIPFSRNREAVMEEAWSIGRQTHLSAIGKRYTPFETRYLHTLHTRKNGAVFQSRVTYDSPRVDALAEGIASQINREPVNAIVSSFDFNTKEFSVTQDIPGRRIEASAIAAALKQALDRGDYQASIPLQSTPLLPRVSSVDLKNSFTRLASFQTKTTSDEDRNFNIALAAQAISNRTLMPGEVFSFNETTGQRTLQKGYRGAPAIQGGVLIDDVGGGVCQVSSTLFYAAAAAGMSIVDRSPHAWPVSYMDRGLDATVNWPNLDFKFRNDQDTPVFIIASYSKRALTVEFYGMLAAPGESIRLEAVTVSSQQPPGQPLMQPNPSLPPFTQKELKPARTGYVVDTFRVYLRNGQEYRREKLFTSSYKMVQQVIEYN